MLDKFALSLFPLSKINLITKRKNLNIEGNSDNIQAEWITYIFI